MDVTDSQLRSALRTLTQKITTEKTVVQRRKEAGRPLFRIIDSKKTGAQYDATVQRITCRYCGARRGIKCVTPSGAVAAHVHVVRVDDAWDIVRGRDSWANVVKRPMLKEPTT